MIEQKDVTETLLYFSPEKADSLIRALDPDQRRFVKVLAQTIKDPQEIWQSETPDTAGAGQWRPMRTYLRFYNISDMDLGASFAMPVVRFVLNSRWELHDMDVIIGDLQKVGPEIDKTIRVGDCAYATTWEPPKE